MSIHYRLTPHFSLCPLAAHDDNVHIFSLPPLPLSRPVFYHTSLLLLLLYFLFLFLLYLLFPLVLARIDYYWTGIDCLDHRIEADLVDTSRHFFCGDSLVVYRKVYHGEVCNGIARCHDDHRVYYSPRCCYGNDPSYLDSSHDGSSDTSGLGYHGNVRLASHDYSYYYCDCYSVSAPTSSRAL
uniref:Uncharacterized protein n=1 Tax=Cacopsylla melanoneura TaxID=428564 RepID=A0A8D9FC09_9HEMI